MLIFLTVGTIPLQLRHNIIVKTSPRKAAKTQCTFEFWCKAFYASEDRPQSFAEWVHENHEGLRQLYERWIGPPPGVQ